MPVTPPGVATAGDIAVDALTSELETVLFNAVKIKDEVVGITAPQVGAALLCRM